MTYSVPTALVSVALLEASRLRSVLCVTGLMLVGCATSIVVTPPGAPTVPPDVLLAGQVVYDGNPDYLPRTVAEAPGPSALTLRYTYTVTYGGTTTYVETSASVPSVPGSASGHGLLEAVAQVDRAAAHGAAAGALIGLLVVPTGKDAVVVTGLLEILEGDVVVRTYTATAELKKTRRRVSEGETLSAMRRRGLLAVRDSIEAQMKAP